MILIFLILKTISFHSVVVFDLIFFFFHYYFIQMALSHAVLYSQFAISITIIRVAIQSILMILMGVRLPSMNDTNASRGLLVTFKRTRLFGQ